jgi:CMP-N-acetylneuraminic acid synthetase
MSDYGTNKKTLSKEVNYLGRDFTDIRENLIEFAKSYFPNQYNDFNEASPGMMFVEMAAYVGDVLNYYVDNQFRETLIQFAEERKNVLAIAQSYGYKPRLATPALVELTFTIDVPAVAIDANNYKPNLDFAGKIESNSTVLANNGTEFTLLDDVDFKVSSSLDTMEVELLKPASGDIPTNYRLKKKGLAQSGVREEEDFIFSNAKEFDKIVLSNDKVTSIVDVRDSQDNKYYEVPFLAQDTVFEDEENSSLNDPSLSQFKNDTPYLLKLIKAARRFTTRVREDDKMELRFGSGISDNADEEIIPNPDNVGSRLGFGVSRLDESFDPSNFLKTRTFGLAPSNTTLTVTYNYGGAVEHNVASNTIQSFNRLTYTNSTTGLNSDTLDTVEASLTVNNEEPASGGSSTETNTEIKQNASAYFNSQNRAVTKADYITRVYSLPQKYGNVAKAYIVQDEQLEAQGQLVVNDGIITDTRQNSTAVKNPLALNMYLLGYNSNKELTRLNTAVKQNIKTYLSQYRLLTDAINLKDGYIINFSVKYNIITQRGYNKNDVLFRTIQKVKDFFAIEKWQMNQPIILSDLAYQISTCDGVVSLVPPAENNPNKELIVIENKYLSGEGYSGNTYDMISATKDGIVYPSLDPSIFELKFPNTDIEGRVVGDK